MPEKVTLDCDTGSVIDAVSRKENTTLDCGMLAQLVRGEFRVQES